MGGIAVAGSILVDRINEISSYPEASQLTKILSVKLATGGCVPNTAIDIKLLDGDVDVYAIGRVGRDADGYFAIEKMNEAGLDTGSIVLTDERTSFTEVMSEIGGRRTFFTYPGASAEFGIDDISLDPKKFDMLHLGYFLLLDKIDAGDGLKILMRATELGIKTSIDLVSENSDRYKLVLPTLPYVDNLIINELEAGKLTGIEPVRENMVEMAKALLALGVRERVIIHEKLVGVLANSSGEVTILPSYKLPCGFIKGTTGAGDAFCAGSLLGIYKGLSDREILEYATISAMGALSAPDASGGMREISLLADMVRDFERENICL